MKQKDKGNCNWKEKDKLNLDRNKNLNSKKKKGLCKKDKDNSNSINSKIIVEEVKVTEVIAFKLAIITIIAGAVDKTYLNITMRKISKEDLV